jgi:glutaredoxin-related protein
MIMRGYKMPISAEMLLKEVLNKIKGKLERPRCRWEDNIKRNVKEIGWEGADWINLAQNTDKRRALVNTVMNFRVPRNAGNFLTT